MKRDKIELTNKLLEVVEMIEVLNFTIEDNVDEEGRVEMIQDYVKLICDYLIPSNTEKKIHAQVMTDFKIIEEILDLHDPSDWKNHKLKFFGPCAGLGNFQVKIVERLMEGLKEWEPDPEKRYKWIVENQIFICELQSKNLFLFMHIFDPENKYKLNFFRGSFLSKEFDEHMKNVWKIEKGDLDLRIDENPPFQRRFDLKILEKCLKISNKIVFVHPSSWLIDEKNAREDFNKIKNFINKHLKNVVLFNGNKVFNIKLFIPCCISNIDLSKEYDTISVYDKINDVYIKYKDIYDINKFSNIHEYFSLKEKIKSEKILSDKYKENYGFNYFVNISRIRGNVNTKSGIKMLKDDFYTIITKDEKVNTEITKEVFFNFETENEANNFIKYIKTNFCRFCLSINKNGSDLNKIDFNRIPWLDFSEEWTDEKLYKKFDLSKNEIEFIEKNIVKYY